MKIMRQAAGVALAATLAAGYSAAADATPYAYASNQISGLTVTLANGGAITPSSPATTSISDSAQFDGYAPDAHQAPGFVGSASSIPQAYSGPGPAPVSTFTPAGAGSFTGTRSLANIGAGSASSGGVSVNNAAEGYGTALGNSVSTNNASIQFRVVGTGQAVKLTFNDLIQLDAATAALAGETANASISNQFSVTPANGSATFYNPSSVNMQVSSNAGVPPNNAVGPNQVNGVTITTDPLANGVTYTLALTSTASETIIPGTATPPTPTPEPASMLILGTALIGAGLARRKRG